MEIKESKRADYTPPAHVLPLGWRNWGEGSEEKEGYLIQVRTGQLRLAQCRAQHTQKSNNEGNICVLKLLRAQSEY